MHSFDPSGLSRRGLCRTWDSLDLSVGPGMLDFGQPVFDAILITTHVEHMRHVPGRRTIGVTRREGELDAVVGEHGVDPVRHRRDQGDEECRGRGSAGLLYQLYEGEFARAINGHIEVELALGGLHFGDVDMEIADWVGRS